MNYPYGKIRLSGHFCVSPNFNQLTLALIAVLRIPDILA